MPIEQMNQRVTRLEGEVDRLKDQISDLHNTSMQFVNTAFAQMEHRLTDKMEMMYRLMDDKIASNVKSSASERMLILSGAFGWIITLAVIIFESLHK